MIVGQKVPTIVAFAGMGTLALSAFLAWYGFPTILNMKLKEAVSLEKGTESYEMFEKPPFPLKFNVRIFNVENPDDVQNGAKPVLKEIGPYVFDMYITRENIEVNEEKDTVKYILKKTFYYNSKETGCRSLEDEVVVLNAALVGVALTVYGMMPSALNLVSTAAPLLFSGANSIFLKTKVKNLLFDGILMDCSSAETEFICQSIGSQAPATIRQHENGRDFLFSFFHHMNATDGGPYVVGAGMKNTSRGEIEEYREEPDLGEMWNSPECNMLNGTDSALFAPFGSNTKPPKRLYAFIADLCRSVYMDLENNTLTFGIPVYHYAIPERLLRAAEDFKCFCPRGQDPATHKEVAKCTPAGTFDLNPCMQAPTIFSWPHFYLGDDKLLDSVSGLNPNKDIHETFAEIEPLTGTPVKGAKRAQFNMQIRKLDGFDLLANVSEVLVPMIWIEEYAAISPEIQKKLTDAYAAINFIDYIVYFLVASGFGLLGIAGVLLTKRDKLFCFSDSRVEHISSSSRRPGVFMTNLDKHSNVSDDLTYNPNLFPQLSNKNINFWKGEEFVN